MAKPKAALGFHTSKGSTVVEDAICEGVHGGKGLIG